MPVASSHYITLIDLYQHGQTKYFTSCGHFGYELSTGLCQRVSTVKILSVVVILQLTDLWYRRRDVGQEVVPHHHRRPLRFGLACGHHNNVDEDSEDVFVRDDAFDEFEAREPQAAAGIVKGARSVFFIYLQ